MKTVSSYILMNVSLGSNEALVSHCFYMVSPFASSDFVRFTASALPKAWHFSERHKLSQQLCFVKISKLQNSIYNIQWVIRKLSSKNMCVSINSSMAAEGWIANPGGTDVFWKNCSFIGPANRYKWSMRVFTFQEVTTRLVCYCKCENGFYLNGGATAEIM